MAKVFVFGSNMQGRHGKGAALEAVKRHGAIYGQAVGRQGDSYAIPTKRTPWTILPRHEVEKHVTEFLKYAVAHPEDEFHVTPIGCGLAGYKPNIIGPMFKGHSANVHLPEEFKSYVS